MNKFFSLNEIPNAFSLSFNLNYNDLTFIPLEDKYVKYHIKNKQRLNDKFKYNYKCISTNNVEHYVHNYTGRIFRLIKGKSSFWFVEDIRESRNTEVEL